MEATVYVFVIAAPVECLVPVKPFVIWRRISEFMNNFSVSDTHQVPNKLEKFTEQIP